MSSPPAYFDAIRKRAASRWDQLERDPELAGPWHQLFKQVQSPRHVLSELLQNADDAGARTATVRLEDGTFVFEHDGEDFSAEHFASLCRFGYSNKRALHTIGFRGIGFKSTFSLGSRVEVLTPTLAVHFDRRRFTEPVWSGRPLRTDGTTCVRVQFSDEHRRLEVQRNLDEWASSPTSLLFFRHIRRLRVGERDVYWRSLGSGPAPRSERLALDEDAGTEVLLVRSEPVPFPDDALAEIRQERMLTDAEESDFPASTIEIVLGVSGRLYVVLPTGVDTALPFACNAPFIQDPARLKIKDPETSPTNRWLLERAGELAASAMLAWLTTDALDATSRARAYDFLPDVNREDNTLGGVCGTTVELAFAERIRGESYLLAYDGGLVPAERCVAVPEQIASIWSAKQGAALFDDLARLPLRSDVSPANRKKLLNWRMIAQIEKPQVLERLVSQHLPKPSTWERLLELWSYLAPELTEYWPKVAPASVRIVPVQGKDVLYAASEVVRLGEKKLLESDADWQFLGTHLLVLDHEWPAFLSELREDDDESASVSEKREVNAAHAVLEKVRLHEAANVNDVMEHVAAAFFANKSLTLADCVRIAQIAARLRAAKCKSVRFVTRDRTIRPADTVIFDERGAVAQFLPEKRRDALLLNDAYSTEPTSCTREEWLDWISSGRAGLHTFPPLIEKPVRVRGRAKIEKELRARGLTDELTFSYKSEDFILQDWDFDAELWVYWEKLARSEPDVWITIAGQILRQPEAYWSGATKASAVHAVNTKRAITSEPLVPAWILRLRGIECLRDTHGFRRKPGDVMRRTPETESLMDVEPFVHASVDHEATRALLDLLGVRTRPLGPDRLLECLRALSRAENAPIHEVEKWYGRLDQMIDVCSTTDLEEIKEAFRAERLVLTEQRAWVTSDSVFLSSDEKDVPGAALIRSSVRHLALWRKLGVADRPTADLAIAWLKSLPSGQRVSQQDMARVWALLLRHAARVWVETGHWLNLAGEWVAVETLSFAISMQSLVPWKHLHEWVKQKTADLQALQAEVSAAPPFAHLRPLAASVRDRLDHDVQLADRREVKAWLATIGMELCRVERDDETETARIRALAKDLAATTWQQVPGLEIIPYIDGVPAGTPRKTDVLWADRVLYVNALPIPKLAKRVPEEIARPFAWFDVRAALDYSFERAPEDVLAYMEQNFTLGPKEESAEAGTGAASARPNSEAHGDDGASTTQSHEHTPTASDPSEPLLTGEEPASEESVAPLDDDEPSEQNEPAVDESDSTHPRAPRPPAKPSIIERFALAHGFSPDGGDRYFREDGSWIGKVTGSPFPWERRSASGDLVRHYLAKDHCLEIEPLELAADLWALIDGMPDDYALVLADASGAPTELLGTQLRELKSRERLKLYPAAYRLVMETE